MAIKTMNMNPGDQPTKEQLREIEVKDGEEFKFRYKFSSVQSLSRVRLLATP